MNIQTLLTAERSKYLTHVESRKQVLNQISELICQDLSDVDCHDLFEAFINRERLGSTGVGHGVAIPHIRSKSVTEPRGAFIALDKGVDFAAPDHEPVDLFFALLVPEDATDEHLKILAHLAVKFNHNDFRQQLRAAKDDNILYKTAIQDGQSQSASL